MNKLKSKFRIKSSLKPKLLKNQTGLVAIIVTVLLILIITLIALGVSENSRREQRQTLDRQLSDQAFYNAETGVNDVSAYLYKNPTAELEITRCDEDIVVPATGQKLSRDIDGPDGVNKVSCLLYDKAPETLQYDKIGTSSPKIVPIQTINTTGTPVSLQSLEVSWDDSSNRDAVIDGDCNFTAPTPVLPENCGYAGVRLEFFRPSSNRSELQKRTFSAFLLPNQTAAVDIPVETLTYPENQGIIGVARCNGGPDVRRCTATITGIGSIAGGSTNLYLNLRALYRPANVTIAGTDNTGARVRFKDTQTVIDSTGRANDVLRRIQVRVPATAQYTYPGFSLQSRDSICKILQVTKPIDGSPGSANSADVRCTVD